MQDLRSVNNWCSSHVRKRQELSVIHYKNIIWQTTQLRKMHNSKAYKESRVQQNLTPSPMYSCIKFVKGRSYLCPIQIRVIMPRLRKLLTFSLRIIFLLKRKIIKSLSLEYNDFFFHIYHWSCQNSYSGKRNLFFQLSR